MTTVGSPRNWRYAKLGKESPGRRLAGHPAGSVGAYQSTSACNIGEADTDQRFIQ